MILAGSFQRAWSGVSAAWQTAYLVMALLAVAGVVLGAWYMLWAVERVFFGPSREPPREAAHGHGDGHGHGHGHAPVDRCDLKWHEFAALAPLAVFVLWIGLAPATFLAPAAAAIRQSTQASSVAFAARMEEPATPAQHVARMP
jgi:NADH-quinone oxidoreductase subunit M